jgi:hypothetical protein
MVRIFGLGFLLRIRGYSTLTFCFVSHFFFQCGKDYAPRVIGFGERFRKRITEMIRKVKGLLRLIEKMDEERKGC